MKAYALLGGPAQLWPQNIKDIFQKAKDNNDLVVGVDRGSLFLEQMHVIPDLAIGDFDSLKKEELSQIENNVADIRYSNPVKDYTDSELMIRTVFQDFHVNSLVILGATGGRLDHFLVNLLMILNPEIRKYAEQISLIDCQNKINFYDSGDFLVKKDNSFSYFGVAALEPVQDLNILKAKYVLKHFDSSYPRVFSSNEFQSGKQEFELRVKKGLIAVIFSKDINRFDNI